MKIILLKETKLIFLLFVLFGFDEAKAQYPLPRPSDNPQWTYINGGPNLGQSSIIWDYSVYKIKYEGDTIIGGTLYDVLKQETSNFGTIEKKDYAYIRQDSTLRSAFIIRKSMEPEIIDSTEKLFISLNSNIGDTAYFEALIQLSTPDSLVSSFILDSVNTIIGIDGVNRAQYFFYPPFQQRNTVFIEGIGFLTNSFRASTYYPKEASTQLICYKENQLEIYYENHNINYDSISCGYIGNFTITSSHNEKTSSDFKIYPNPSIGNVNLIFGDYIKKNHFKGKILNFSGQQVYEFKIESENTVKTLDLSFLPNGMYIVQIDTDKGLINKKINVLK